MELNAFAANYNFVNPAILLLDLDHRCRLRVVSLIEIKAAEVVAEAVL